MNEPWNLRFFAFAASVLIFKRQINPAWRLAVKVVDYIQSVKISNFSIFEQSELNYLLKHAQEITSYCIFSDILSTSNTYTGTISLITSQSKDFPLVKLFFNIPIEIEFFEYSVLQLIGYPHCLSLSAKEFPKFEIFSSILDEYRPRFNELLQSLYNRRIAHSQIAGNFSNSTPVFNDIFFFLFYSSCLLYFSTTPSPYVYTSLTKVLTDLLKIHLPMNLKGLTASLLINVHLQQYDYQGARFVFEDIKSTIGDYSEYFEIKSAFDRILVQNGY
ncbi:hypothetical protein GEMRC1_009780 [Eukaryota sp. GEM-RC1]